MKTALCTCLSLLLSLTVSAQIQLSGNVVSYEQKPIEFAAVGIHPTGDSTQVKGGITNQAGAYSIPNLPVGSYQLTVQMLGYERWQQAIDLTGDVQLPPIILKEEASLLGEVVVVAEQSVVENHLGKKVLKLGKDLTATGSSALEALEIVPSVTTTSRGQVQIRGNANVIIFINGKATRRDPSTLRFIAAESLEKIEIITNPSAEYDAEGVGGILNLVYKKDKSASLKVEVISNLTVLTTPASFNPNGGINASFTNNKVSFFTNLSHDYGRYEDYSDTKRNHFGGGLERYENLTVHNGLGNISNALIGFSFEPDSATSLGLEINYDRWDYQSKIQQQSIFDYRQGADQSVNFQNRGRDSENELWVNFSFEKEFLKDKTLKGSVSAGGEDERNTFASEDADRNGLPFEVQQFLRSSDEFESQRYYQGILDYKAPFFNWGTMDVGFKADFIRYHIFQEINLRSNTIQLPDNDFNMNLQKLGVYLVQKKTINRLEYGIGLRLEQFSSKAVQEANQATFTQEYTRLFPSLQLNYLLPGDAHTLGFSYTRRINRPGFFALNPYISYEDPLNLETGNPGLRPEIADLLELNYHQEWNKLNIDLSLYKRTTNDAIQSVVRSIDNNRSLASPVNIGRANNSGVEVQLEYKPTKKFKATGSLVVAQNRFEDAANEISYARQRTWSIRLRQLWELPKDWKIEFSETYRAPSYQIQQKNLGVYYANVGLRKKLNNQRGSLSLSIRDVFNTRRDVYTLLTSDFEIERSYKWQTRQVTLGLSYTIVDKKK